MKSTTKNNKSQIHFFVMDVDGTLTDGKLYIGNDGEVIKAFDIKDGFGIHDILIPSGIRPVIITGRKSGILEKRCHELGISDLHQGINNKIDKLNEIIEIESKISNKKYTLKNVAYIGDDLNDLECMKAVKSAGGVIGCPADASKQLIMFADFISIKQGGNGAVREFIEWIIFDPNIN